jgi:hypothetical protein
MTRHNHSLPYRRKNKYEREPASVDVLEIGNPHNNIITVHSLLSR